MQFDQKAILASFGEFKGNTICLHPALSFPIISPINNSLIPNIAYPPKKSNKNIIRKLIISINYRTASVFNIYF